MATNDRWTLAELREWVEEAGDFYSPGFSPTLKDRWINNGIQAFVDLVFEVDDTRFMREGTITVVAGTDSYDLKDAAVLTADDYYRARGFCVPDGSSASGFTRIRKFEWHARHDYDAGVRNDNLYAMWDVIGNELKIWPKPQWGGACLLEYFPLGPKLVEDNDQVDLRNHPEFVVNYACMHLAPRDESSKRDWADLLARSERRIRAGGPQNRAEPKTAENVYGDRKTRNQRRMARIT